MELANFCIEDGYAEAILRGLRASFITESQYNQIKSCSTLQELKSLLEETDYANHLITESNDIQIPVLVNKLKKKLAEEMEYITAQTTGKLNSFLQVIQYKYMIDNVVNMIEGIKNKVDVDELIAQSDPLGYFPEMKNIKVIEGNSDDFTGLYRDVLIDTPIGPFFMRFLEEALQNSESKTLNDVQNIFKEMKSEYIRTSLKKMWLETFYDFCGGMNSTTAEMMKDLLSFEADFKTIQVVYNTIGQKDMNAAKINETRKDLCPALGYLYPDCKQALAGCNNIEALRDVVKGVDNYRDIMRDAPDPSKKEDFNFSSVTLDDIMFNDECRRYALAWDQAAHYTVFYAYLKLKEQEIRNIKWLAEMITRKLPKNHAGWKKIIVPFSHLRNAL